MSEPTTLIVNHTNHRLEVEPDRSLLDVLREDLGLTGCKIGCGEGACGACTVLLDGQTTRSCVTPITAALGHTVDTVEGLAMQERLHPLQQAFLDADAMQCGYCTPGMLMAALGLLKQNPEPSDEAIVAAMQGNICRCGTYTRIVRAIQQAALALRSQPGGAQ